VSLVLVDNRKGARLAVDYLAGQGHSAIGMLAGPVTSPSSLQRIEGFCGALAAHRLPAPGDWILPAPPTIEGGYRTGRDLLARHPQVTALFAYNDLSALGAIQACRELGRRVPADCSIVGFDDIRLAALTSPALTSVRVDKYSLGQQAMIRLLAMLDEPDAAFSPVCIDVELVVRESA
jgi:DNA-binding LacI/PurR family transcriptional regulator